MKTHLRSMAKRKVSDFLLREEGMVGNRSAFATAAVVSTASLAMTLLVAPDAEGHHGCPEWNCGPEADCRYCDPRQDMRCCMFEDNGEPKYRCIGIGAAC